MSYEENILSIYLNLWSDILGQFCAIDKGMDSTVEDRL